MIFRKWGGGVKGHSELFWKFIHFGMGIRPSCWSRVKHNFNPQYFILLPQQQIVNNQHITRTGTINTWWGFKLILRYALLTVEESLTGTPPPPSWLRHHQQQQTEESQEGWGQGGRLHLPLSLSYPPQREVFGPAFFFLSPHYQPLISMKLRSARDSPSSSYCVTVKPPPPPSPPQ